MSHKQVACSSDCKGHRKRPVERRIRKWKLLWFFLALVRTLRVEGRASLFLSCIQLTTHSTPVCINSAVDLSRWYLRLFHILDSNCSFNFFHSIMSLIPSVICMIHQTYPCCFIWFSNFVSFFEFFYLHYNSFPLPHHYSISIPHIKPPLFHHVLHLHINSS